MNTGPGRVAEAGQRRPPEVTLAGWALLLAPLLLLTGEVLHPQRSARPAQQLAIVAGHPSMWYASHLLLFAGIALTLPAITGIVYLLGQRARRLAVLGASLAFVGIVCFAGLLTIGFVVWQMAGPGADRQQMAALFGRLFHATGFVIPFQALPLAFAAGMVLLAIGLDRVTAVPRWVALCLGSGATALSLAGIVPGAIYAMAASAVFAAGMVPIGTVIVTGDASLPVRHARAAG